MSHDIPVGAVVGGANIPPRPSRRSLGTEVVIVLALSLGASGVNALIRLIDMATRAPLSDHTARLNPSASPRPWIDLAYQLSGIAFSLAPVALVLYLLARHPGGNPFARLGFDARRPLGDAAWGAGLFLLIGVGTLGVYSAGRALGITAAISTSGLATEWWSVPVLILAAARNGVLEEVIVVGYLADRLRELRWGTAGIVVASAVLRGSYHLYQGVGPFLGNVAMGVLFAWLYLRKGRVMPLVIAHTLLDVVAFVGFPLLATHFGYGS